MFGVVCWKMRWRKKSSALDKLINSRKSEVEAKKTSRQILVAARAQSSRTQVSEKILTFLGTGWLLLVEPILSQTFRLVLVTNKRQNSCLKR